MTNGRNKGMAFEREIARRLSLWITNGADPGVIVRRAGSGGFKKDLAGTSGQGGDLSSEKIEGFKITNDTIFELKFYKSLQNDLWNHVCGRKSKITDFIAQAKAAAKPYDRNWAVIMKCNNMPIVVISNSTLLTPTRYSVVLGAAMFTFDAMVADELR